MIEFLILGTYLVYELLSYVFLCDFLSLRPLKHREVVSPLVFSLCWVLIMFNRKFDKL